MTAGMSLPGSPLATIAAERADVADLRVGDQQRGLANERRRIGYGASSRCSSCWVVMAPMTQGVAVR